MTNIICTRDSTQDVIGHASQIDNNTLYNITDDTDVSLTILEALYPVGSVYITTANTCPLSTLISGSTWELVSSGRVLQGADSGHSAGTTIEAGLPNIEGTFTFADNIVKFDPAGGYGMNIGGCIEGQSYTANTCSITNVAVVNVESPNRKIAINASHSNPIYGNSSTVQPPAYIVNIYRRTA